MNFLEKIKSTFFKSKPQEDGFSTAAGTQKYILDTFPFLFDSEPKWMSLYKELFDNVSIIDNAIDTYVQLINPGYIIESDKEKEVEAVYEVLDYIEFQEELNKLIQNTLIYGFNGSEVVLSSDLRSILRFVNVPSKDLRIKRDKKANIVKYYEINTGGKFVELNTNRFIYFTKQATTDEPYGRSLLRALPFLTRIMLEMQDSIGKIYKKYGSPRFHVNYIPKISLDDATLTRRLNMIKEKFDNPKVGEDFFSAGDVQITTIGAEGEAIRFNIEMSEILQGVLSGLKLPAGVLGYNYGSTETHLAKQLEILLGRVTSYQKYYASVLNKQFMPLLAKVYNLSEVPKIQFERPIIVDEQVEAATRSIEISNIQTLKSMGIITDEYAIEKLELPKLSKAALDKIQQKNIEDNMAMMGGPDNQNGKDNKNNGKPDPSKKKKEEK